MAVTSLRYMRPARERFVVEQLSDGSMAVFDRAGDAVHSLNPAAAAVWVGCAEPASVDDLCDALAEGTSNPPRVEAIDATVRRLLEVGLLQEVRDGSAALPLGTSRRQLLKRIGGAAAAAVALPVVLTLAGKEQRLLAQGCGSTSLNLTGCWTMEPTDAGPGDDPAELVLTQSGNTITGTITAPGSSGTLTGTLCGTTLHFVATVTFGTCSAVLTFDSTSVTATTFAGSGSTQFAASGCGSNDGQTLVQDFTATMQCVI